MVLSQQLRAAARHGNIDELTAILEGEGLMHVNDADDDGTTPLLMACCYGHTPCVDALLNFGADANLAGKHGITPTFFTCQENKPECLKLLIAQKADLNIPNSQDGGSPLYIACSKNNTECVHLLLEAGADVNLSRKDGSTSVQAALKKKNLGIAKLCIQYGAEIDRKLPPANKTPFQLAMEIVNEKDAETRKEYMIGMYEGNDLCGMLCEMLKADNSKLKIRIAAREAGEYPPETDRSAHERQMTPGGSTDRSVSGKSKKKKGGTKKEGDLIPAEALPAAAAAAAAAAAETIAPEAPAAGTKLEPLARSPTANERAIARLLAANAEEKRMEAEKKAGKGAKKKGK